MSRSALAAVLALALGFGFSLLGGCIQVGKRPAAASTPVQSYEVQRTVVTPASETTTTVITE